RDTGASAISRNLEGQTTAAPDQIVPDLRADIEHNRNAVLDCCRSRHRPLEQATIGFPAVSHFAGADRRGAHRLPSVFLFSTRSSASLGVYARLPCRDGW